MSTEVNALLDGLNIEQRKWVLARLLVTSDAKAAREVGIDPATVSRWPNKAELTQIVETLLSDPIRRVVEELREALPEASRVKREGLKSRNEGIRQDAASEIFDRVLGKPMQPTEVSGKGGGAVIIAIGGIDPDNDI